MDPNKSFKYRSKKYKTNSGSAIFANPSRERMPTGNPLTSRPATKYDGIQYRFECRHCRSSFITTFWHQTCARYKDIERCKRNSCGSCGGLPDWAFLAFKLVSR